MEAASKIRFSAKIQGANKDRAEAEARSKAEADIREKAYKTRKRVDAEARVWEKANSVQRAAAEAVANIRVKAESEIAKRDRA